MNSSSILRLSQTVLISSSVGFTKLIHDPGLNSFIFSNLFVFKSVLYIQSEYSYLSFTPIVNEYQSGQFKEGVHICMNTQDVWFDMTIDELYGFYYILTNTSMYNLAAEMVNYIKSQPYGVNKTELKGLGSGGGAIYNNYQTTKSGADFLNSK